MVKIVSQKKDNGKNNKTFLTPLGFYAPQLVPPGTAEARISYGISVHPSVTTRYGFNAR